MYNITILHFEKTSPYAQAEPIYRTATINAASDQEAVKCAHTLALNEIGMLCTVMRDDGKSIGFNTH